jgi:hypothetical protein
MFGAEALKPRMSSFAPLGLEFCSRLYPRLTPWATFLRRFAANGKIPARWPQGSSGDKFLGARVIPPNEHTA